MIRNRRRTVGLALLVLVLVLVLAALIGVHLVVMAVHTGHSAMAGLCLVMLALLAALAMPPVRWQVPVFVGISTGLGQAGHPVRRARVLTEGVVLRR